MIYAELRNYLGQVADLEVVDLFDRSIELLDRIEFEDYLNDLDALIGETSDCGDDAVLDALREHMNNLMHSLLIQHGVTVHNHASFADRLTILEALIRVSDYPEKGSLIREVEAAMSPEELIAAVVATMTSMALEKVLSLIDTVYPGVVAVIKEVLEGPKALELEDVQLAQARQVEYAKFRIVFDKEQRWTDRFATYSQSVGLPYALYAKYYLSQQVTHDLSNEDQDAAQRQICINLIGMGCLSEEGVVNTADNAKPYLERICPDMSKLTPLYSKLTNLLLEFNRAQT